MLAVSAIPAEVEESASDDWRTAMDWIQVGPAPALSLLHWAPRIALSDSVQDLWTWATSSAR